MHTTVTSLHNVVPCTTVHRIMCDEFSVECFSKGAVKQHEMQLRLPHLQGPKKSLHNVIVRKLRVGARWLLSGWVIAFLFFFCFLFRDYFSVQRTFCYYYLLNHH